MKVTKQQRDESLATLRNLLKPHDTVYCVLRNVSRSGMSRDIDLFVMVENAPRRITWSVAQVTGYTMSSKTNALKVTGAGMDMGFAVVYNLSRTLFPDGFAPNEIGTRPMDKKLVNVNIGRGHSGPMTRTEMAVLAAKGWTFAGGRNGDTSGWDNDGGYALNQRWM